MLVVGLLPIAALALYFTRIDFLTRYLIYLFPIYLISRSKSSTRKMMEFTQQRMVIGRACAP